jgi:hypothetical protein
MLREISERRRRRDALRAAHAKARAVHDSTAASPLLALPDTVLDGILSALDSESPVAAARLACVHSAFLAAYTRLFRWFPDLDALRASLAAEAAAAAAAPQPAALQSPPPRLFVRCADLAYWPAGEALPPLTLMHAKIQASWFADLPNEDRIANINACVLGIHKLEVDCGHHDMDMDCPNCGDYCVCDGEDVLKAKEENALAIARKDARETLENMRRQGFTGTVRRMQCSFTFGKGANYPGFGDNGEVCGAEVELHEQE